MDKETLRDVERLRFLAAKAQRDVNEESELAKLNSELSVLGFSKEFRDPLYKEFVKEMEKERKARPELWTQVLTPQQRQFRAQLVSSVVQKLRSRQESE